MLSGAVLEKITSTRLNPVVSIPCMIWVVFRQWLLSILMCEQSWPGNGLESPHVQLIYGTYGLLGWQQKFSVQKAGVQSAKGNGYDREIFHEYGDTETGKHSWPVKSRLPEKGNKETAFRCCYRCPQTFAAFSVYSFALSLGASSGFSGVVIPQLQDRNATGFDISQDQISWFGKTIVDILL